MDHSLLATHQILVRLQVLLVRSSKRKLFLLHKRLLRNLSVLGVRVSSINLELSLVLLLVVQHLSLQVLERLLQPLLLQVLVVVSGWSILRLLGSLTRVLQKPITLRLQLMYLNHLRLVLMQVRLLVSKQLRLSPQLSLQLLLVVLLLFQ